MKYIAKQTIFIVVLLYPQSCYCGLNTGHLRKNRETAHFSSSQYPERYRAGPSSYQTRTSVKHPVHRLHLVLMCSKCSDMHHFTIYWPPLYGASLNTKIMIIIINIKDWTLWSFPSPELQQLAPTLLRSSNCSPSLWSVVVWFQRDSVLWHSLQV